MGNHLGNSRMYSWLCRIPSSCPKCYEIFDDEIKDSIPGVKRAVDILSDDLPF
jgi:hypothetical protein